MRFTLYEKPAETQFIIRVIDQSDNDKNSDSRRSRLLQFYVRKVMSQTGQGGK